MSDALSLSVGMLAGVALGAVFFVGLWWTVHRAVPSATPALWFMMSLLGRTGMVACGFFAVARDDWRRLPACLVGFLISRSVVIRLSRRPRIAAVAP